MEQILDERNYGRWKKKQYLVKWKGYPDLDNQWLDAKDMENAQELIAEFHKSNNELCSHIRRALGRLHFLHPLSSALPSTSTSEHMSDAAHSSDHSTAVENTNPLPVPPHKVTSDVTTPSVLVQVPPIQFVRIRDEDFPHPDEPTPSELNDSDQENIAPPVQAVPRTGPTIHTPLGRTQAAIPFSEDVATNQAILAAITRVRNTVDRGDTYVVGIEEIVRIARTLRHRGSPSEDDEAAALVAQLHQIRRLGSESESSSSEAPAPANVTLPTSTIPRNSQVMASTAASCARIRAVASGPTSPQQHRPRGARGAGSQARRMGGRVQPIPTGIRVGAELLSPRPTRRAETPPPLGFNFNQGVNFVPCVVTNNEGRSVPARYTRVIMGPDTHVIGIIPGDRSQYGGPLHAIPDHGQEERPRYAHDDLWRFKNSADERARFDNALNHIHDLSLIAEVARYREASHLFHMYQEEVRRIEEHMWEAGQLQDASARRLEGANALDRIEAAAEELDRRAVLRQERECTERGRLSRSGLIISFLYLPSSSTYPPYVITFVIASLLRHNPLSYPLYITHY